MTALTEFRAGKDDFFAHGEHSPLTPEQQAAFTHLDYFPENPDLRFLAPVEILPEPETIEVTLSTGESTEYQRWGRIHLTVANTPVTLSVFRSEDGDLFLPFKDTTARTGETYGAGRYLEPDVAPTGELVIDFNYAYNPYCAYNEDWACPLTPAENVLDVPIAAGEKAFTGGHP